MFHHCPLAHTQSGRLNHLLMSYPQLSLTITLRKNMVSHVTGFNMYSIQRVYSIHVYHALKSTGLKHELNNRDKATINIPQTPMELPLLARMETHQTVSLLCMLSAHCSHVRCYWILVEQTSVSQHALSQFSSKNRQTGEKKGKERV